MAKSQSHFNWEQHTVHHTLLALLILVCVVWWSGTIVHNIAMLFFQGLGNIFFSPVAAQTGDVAQEVRLGLAAAGVTDVEVEGPPRGLEEAYRYLLTPSALQFVANLTRHFNDRVDRVSHYSAAVFRSGCTTLLGNLT